MLCSLYATRAPLTDSVPIAAGARIFGDNFSKCEIPFSDRAALFAERKQTLHVQPLDNLPRALQIDHIILGQDTRRNSYPGRL